MRNINKKLFFIGIGAIILVVGGLHFAHAGDTLTGINTFGGFSFGQLVNYGIAQVFNFGLKLMGYVLALAGLLLNFSVNLTLRIKDFVDHAPGIYTTWKSIRDISGLFIIFFLLFAAIQMILGVGNPKWGELIKNIVLAGVLINFSFFFAGLGIDASNIVSMQLYNAIAPANDLGHAPSTYDQNGVGASINSTWGDGGLSDIFVKSLQITTLYNVAGQQGANLNQGSSGSWADTLKIPFIGFTGIIIELAAAISFGVAAVAFIMRFVILLFLLAFSPIWFLSFLPNVKEYVGEWVKWYKGMLLFMPVYLLLMYLALNVLTTTPLFQPSTVATATGWASQWYGQFMVLFVNAAIVMFLLNMPLVAAASIAGKSMSFLEKVSKNFSAARISQVVGGFAGTHTVGAAAGSANDRLGKTWLGNTITGRMIRKNTLGAVAGSKMGGLSSHTERVKEQKDVDKVNVERRRENAYKEALKNAKAGKPPVPGPGGSAPITVGTYLGKMSEKEKLALSVNDLSHPEVVKYLTKKDMESILKSDDGSLSDDDKSKIVLARNKLLTDAFTNANNAKDKVEFDKVNDVVKGMLKNMEIDEFIGAALKHAKDTGTQIQDIDAVVANMTPGRLKDVVEKSLLDAKQKTALGGRIDNWDSYTKINPTAFSHPAQTYINKPENKSDWI